MKKHFHPAEDPRDLLILVSDNDEIIGTGKKISATKEMAYCTVPSQYLSLMKGVSCSCKNAVQQNLSGRNSGLIVFAAILTKGKHVKQPHQEGC